MAMDNAVAATKQRMTLPLENGGTVSSGGGRTSAQRPKQIPQRMAQAAGQVYGARKPRPGTPPPQAPGGVPTDAVMKRLPQEVSGNPELMNAVKSLTSNPTFQSQVMNGGEPTDAARAAGGAPPQVQGRPLNPDGTITGANGGIQQLGDAARRNAGLPPALGAGRGTFAPKPVSPEGLPIDAGQYTDAREVLNAPLDADPAAAVNARPELHGALEQFSQGQPQRYDTATPGALAELQGGQNAGGGFNLFGAQGVRDRIRSLVSRPPMQKAVAGSPMPAAPAGPGNMGGVRQPLAR